jgi:hypothetical protein
MSSPMTENARRILPDGHFHHDGLSGAPEVQPVKRAARSSTGKNFARFLTGKSAEVAREMHLAGGLCRLFIILSMCR